MCFYCHQVTVATLCWNVDSHSAGLRDEVLKLTSFPEILMYKHHATKTEYKKSVFSHVLTPFLSAVGFNDGEKSTPFMGCGLKSVLHLYLRPRCSMMGNNVETQMRKLDNCTLIWICDVTICWNLTLSEWPQTKVAVKAVGRYFRVSDKGPIAHKYKGHEVFYFSWLLEVQKLNLNSWISSFQVM